MKYVLSPQAIDDIFEIATHLDQENIDASIRVSKTLVNACEAIAAYPSLGKTRKVNASKTVRIRLANPRWPYLIVYDPDVSPLRILRILHGARNLDRILKTL